MLEGIMTWETALVVGGGLSLAYATGRIVRSDVALNWAKDRLQELNDADAAGQVPDQYRNLHTEAKATLQTYIDGLADGKLTYMEGIKTAWHAWRTAREFWRLVA